jgi:hypothetical protein
MRRSFTSCASVVADVDIDLRARCRRKLFLDDACPICLAALGRSVAVCALGHGVCGACQAAWGGSCAVCRDPDVEVVALEDDEEDLAFERDMAAAAALAPARPGLAAGIGPAEYGEATGNGLTARLFTLRAVEAAAATLVVLLDVSGSMREALPLVGLGGVFAECAATGARLCVVTFGSDARTVFGPARVSPGDVPPRPRADGGTALHLGLDHVGAIVDGLGDDVCEVRVVTDGEADDRALAIEAMRRLAGRADVRLVATGAYTFANCSELLDNDTSRFEFVAPHDVEAALMPAAGLRRVSVGGDEGSRMYRNGNVTAPVGGVHAFFDGAGTVAFTGNVDVAALGARHAPGLDFEVRRFVLSATGLSYAKRATFAHDLGAGRARKLERARRVVAKYGSFPEIAAMIDAGIESIEAGREQSNALARMATCAARAHTQVA